MNKDLCIKIIQEMPRTFPLPHLILHDLVTDDYLLLGINKKHAYLAQFSLDLQGNGRYYPKYKNFSKTFDDKKGLMDYEHFIKEIYDAMKYEIIFDLIYFNELHV